MEQVEHKAEQVEHKAEQVEHKAEQVEHKAEQVEHKAEQVEHKAEQVEPKAEQVEHKAEQVEHKYKPKKRLQCINWLENQNSNLQKRSGHDKKNDLKYIIPTNADRKKLLLPVEGEAVTLPTGVGEPVIEPKFVPPQRLLFDKLSLECEWQMCRICFSNYDLFQKHVIGHIINVEKIQKKAEVIYVCLWDVCGHKTPNFDEMVRHINYHSYHARLLAIGLNSRATYELPRCKKDSRNRNILPSLPNDHCCMWTGCEEKFNSIQIFFWHVKQHTLYLEKYMCSWAGCGAIFRRMYLLQRHLQCHTKERITACYHCGKHYWTFVKLKEHLLRQNVSPDSPFVCSLCGTKCATEYLLNEHTRQHVSKFVCALCDMTAPSASALAHHVRYRHLAPSCSRVHSCPECTYRAVSKFDLNKHILTHKKKKKIPDEDLSDDNEVKTGYDSDGEPKTKKKVAKKYACHLCPEIEMKTFCYGNKLTKHLVKKHGAQWPSGHSRFRYQRSEDGMYRLTTTRYEVLEVVEKIVDRNSGPKQFLTNKCEFSLVQIAKPTYDTPRRFQITFKSESSEEGEASKQVAGVNDEANSKNDSARDAVVVNNISDIKLLKVHKVKNVKTVKETYFEPLQNSVEITMCDVDDQGNVIRSEVMYS